MHNCVVVGCSELIDIEERYCESHLKKASKRRIQLGMKEAQAFKACSRYHAMFMGLLKGRSLPCFNCEDGEGQTIHCTEDREATWDEKLMVLCHKCHAAYHQK